MNQIHYILHCCLQCGIVQDLSEAEVKTNCMVCNSPELEEDIFYLDDETGEVY